MIRRVDVREELRMMAACTPGRGPDHFGFGATMVARESTWDKYLPGITFVVKMWLGWGSTPLCDGQLSMLYKGDWAGCLVDHSLY